MKILITGAAGFIGFHLAKRLLEEEHSVIGYDNLNEYYDVDLKLSRLKILNSYSNFAFFKGDLQDKEVLSEVFKSYEPTHVVNLAAQAGVRYSLTNPDIYIDSNIKGFLNVLECSKQYKIEHLVYASSSSVYGGNTKLPFSTTDNVDKPISLYAATKKANELMAYTYSHLFEIPTTGLRFFTVYGPWGRPDMALFLFTEAILKGIPIKVFNNGKMMRDFTYIDDIIDGVVKLINNKPMFNESICKLPTSNVETAPYRIYNIGNNNPVELEYFIEVLERFLGKKAIKEYFPIQPGDVPKTCADINDLVRDIGFRPSKSIEYGIEKFVEWYRQYYK